MDLALQATTAASLARLAKANGNGHNSVDGKLTTPLT